MSHKCKPSFAFRLTDSNSARQETARRVRLSNSPPVSCAATWDPRQTLGPSVSRPGLLCGCAGDQSTSRCTANFCIKCSITVVFSFVFCFAAPWGLWQDTSAIRSVPTITSRERWRAQEACEMDTGNSLRCGLTQQHAHKNSPAEQQEYRTPITDDQIKLSARHPSENWEVHVRVGWLSIYVDLESSIGREAL